MVYKYAHQVRLYSTYRNSSSLVRVNNPYCGSFGTLQIDFERRSIWLMWTGQQILMAQGMTQFISIIYILR